MVEDKIIILNDLDIQIRDLEDEIKKVKEENEQIKLNVHKKLMILQQLDAELANEEK